MLDRGCARARLAELRDVERERAHRTQREQMAPEPAAAVGGQLVDAIDDVGQVHEQQVRAAVRADEHVLLAPEGRDRPPGEGERAAERREEQARPGRVGLHELVAAMGGGVVPAVRERGVEIGMDMRHVHRHEAEAGRGRLQADLGGVGAGAERSVVASDERPIGVVLSNGRGEGPAIVLGLEVRVTPSALRATPRSPEVIGAACSGPGRSVKRRADRPGTNLRSTESNRNKDLRPGPGASRLILSQPGVFPARPGRSGGEG